MSALAFPLLGYALEHALASGIVALIAFALCRTKAIAPGARAGILLAALALCVFAPLSPRLDGIGVGAAAQAHVAPIGMSDRTGARIESARIEPQAAQPAMWKPGPIRIGESAALLLIAVWCLGAVWRIAGQVRGQMRLRRIVAASKRSHALEAEYRDLLRPGVEIRLCAAFGPAAVDVLRPKILMPERLAAALPIEAMRAVILHEASHIRRRDLAAHAFQKLVEALFWWNPMVRWMAASLDVSREIACDIAASRACATPAEYADALLTAIEHAAPSPSVRLAPALGVADALRTLDQRIDGIIETRAAAGVTARLAPAAVLLCMIAACATAAAVSRPLAPVLATPKPAIAEADSGVDADAVEKASASVSRIPASVATEADTVPRRSAAVPSPAKARVAQSRQPADTNRAQRPDATIAPEDIRRIASQADEEYRRAASQSDEAYRRAAARSDEDYQRSASQADEDYVVETALADEAYQRRFAALEHATPAAAFEARLALAGRERERAVAAAGGKYKTRMAEANEKFRTRMADAKGGYETRMAVAKARYDSAMKRASGG